MTTKGNTREVFGVMDLFSTLIVLEVIQTYMLKFTELYTKIKSILPYVHLKNKI